MRRVTRSASIPVAPACPHGDRIQEVANQHLIIRQRRGHGDVAADQRWGVQTLKDPRRRFTPEVLERIKAVVVRAGHALVKQARPRG